jgi:hypothetical protein
MKVKILDSFQDKCIGISPGFESLAIKLLEDLGLSFNEKLAKKARLTRKMNIQFNSDEDAEAFLDLFLDFAEAFLDPFLNF